MRRGTSSTQKTLIASLHCLVYMSTSYGQRYTVAGAFSRLSLIYLANIMSAVAGSKGYSQGQVFHANG